MELWIILSLCSAIAMTVHALAKKKLLFEQHALEYSTSASIVTACICIMLLPFVSFSFSLEGTLLTYGISVLLTGIILYITKAERHLDISAVHPLMNLSPLFLLVTAFFMLGEIPTGMQIIGVFFIVTGAYILQARGNVGNIVLVFKEGIHNKYFRYMVLALMVVSVVHVFDKIIITTFFDPISFLALVWIFVAINFGILEYYRYGFSEVMHSIKKHGVLLFVSSFFFVLQGLLQLNAMTLQNVGLVIPIKRMSTLFVTIIGGSFFHEEGLRLKILACCIMLVGVICITT